MVNQNSPLISIITISFNAADEIEKTIVSVKDQSYKNLEHIIIDGGSTDGTLDIIKKYQANFSYWISEKDNGISDAFNKGINVAKGELIGILNAGDTYRKDALKKIIETYHNFHADVIYGDVLFHNNSKKYLPETNHAYLIESMALAHPGVFVKKETYNKYGHYSQDYKLAMDYEFLLRIYLQGAYFKKIISADKVIADFYEDGVSSSNWIKARKESLRIKNKYAILRRSKVMNYLFFCYDIIGTWITKFR